MRVHRDITDFWESYCVQRSDQFLKLTQLLQVLVTRRYFAGGGSFQDVCGELIGVVQDRPLRSISSLLWGAFRCLIDINYRSNSTPYLLRITAFLTAWLLAVGTSLVRRAPILSENSSFVLSKVCLSHSLMCLDFHDYPRNDNNGKKVKINIKNAMQQTIDG